MEKKDIIKILKDNNIRITENRLAIFSCLADDNNFHTVAEIQNHVNDLNTKSVYNNLKALIKEGIDKTYCFNGNSKYTVADKYKNH